MELNKTSRWLYLLLGLWILFILSLGAWWTHLYLKFSDFSVVSMNPEQFYSVTRMLKWEGITVFIGLLALSVLIIYIFTRDLKKTQSIRSFFATMTHEMKTPLASIKLQVQVLTDLLKDLDHQSYSKIEPFADRLLEDGKKLEFEMDQILQLARLESGGHLNLENISLAQALSETAKSYPDFIFTINSHTQDAIIANSYALTLVFRNLIENTRRHQPHRKEITINITLDQDKVLLIYNDGGNSFNGDLSKLGNLFYKHHSEKGTGMGLYLIDKLMKHMNGEFNITAAPNLNFNLIFSRAANE